MARHNHTRSMRLVRPTIFDVDLNTSHSYTINRAPTSSSSSFHTSQWEDFWATRTEEQFCRLKSKRGREVRVEGERKNGHFEFDFSLTKIHRLPMVGNQRGIFLPIGLCQSI